MHHQSSRTLLRVYLEGLAQFYAELLGSQQVEDDAALLQVWAGSIAEGVSRSLIAAHTDISECGTLILPQDTQIHADLLVCHLCQGFGKLYGEAVYHVVLQVFARIIELLLIGGELLPCTHTGQCDHIMPVMGEKVTQRPVWLTSLSGEAEAVGTSPDPPPPQKALWRHWHRHSTPRSHRRSADLCHHYEPDSSHR